MKVVVAIDSLKGSMTSMEAGRAIREGILNVLPDTEVIVKPLADGGEGTTEALVEGLGGELVETEVHGPLETPVKAVYGVIKETGTAIMEMAAAAGIILVGKDKRPLDATTYGVGEMIRDAVRRGCREFIIGIGGSATNDGGIGMLKALGYEFYDKDGADTGEGAQALEKVESVNTKNRHPLIPACNFRIACDVNNPLCGENGATYIYGPQKGVTGDLKETLDNGMANFAKATAAALGQDHSAAAGAGAAGGLGFAFLSYIGAELTPGIKLILDVVSLEDELKDADIAITGEGRLDHQTAMGKAPVGVARLAKKYGAKVIAFAGTITEGASVCNDAGIDAFFPIVRGVTTLVDAMKKENAQKNMAAAAEQVFRLL